MALQVGPAKALIREVGDLLGAEAATRLAERLGECHTPAEVAKVAEEARKLLRSQGGSLVRVATHPLPAEIGKVIDQVLAANGLGELNRGAMVVSLEPVVGKQTPLEVRGNYKFQILPPEKKAFVMGMIQDALFWVDLEAKPNGNDGFKFLAASYGLANAQIKADDQALQGKPREDFLRPHQDLYTMFNPYSGNGQEM